MTAVGGTPNFAFVDYHSVLNAVGFCTMFFELRHECLLFLCAVLRKSSSKTLNRYRDGLCNCSVVVGVDYTGHTSAGGYSVRFTTHFRVRVCAVNKYRILISLVKWLAKP